MHSHLYSDAPTLGANTHRVGLPRTSAHPVGLLKRQIKVTYVRMKKIYYNRCSTSYAVVSIYVYGTSYQIMGGLSLRIIEMVQHRFVMYPL